MSEPEKLSVPPALRRRVKAFRTGDGQAQGVFVRDDVLDQEHTFEPWQFFVLEVLFGCQTHAELSAAFEQRFGKVRSDEAGGAGDDDTQWCDLSVFRLPECR